MNNVTVRFMASLFRHFSELTCVILGSRLVWSFKLSGGCPLCHSVCQDILKMKDTQEYF